MDVVHEPQMGPGLREGMRAGTRTRLRAWARLFAPPRRVYPYAGSLMVLVMLVHPFVMVPILHGPLDERVRITSDMVLLLENIAVLGAAVVLKFEWRFSRNPATGWICAMLAMTSVQALPFSLLAVAGSPYGGFGKVNGFSSVPLGVIMIAIVVMAIVGRKGPPRNPLLVGVPLGALIGAIRLTFVLGETDPTAHLGDAGVVALELATAVLTVVLIALLTQVDGVPVWVRLRLCLYLGLITLGASFPNEGTYGPAPVGQLALSAVAVTLLVGTVVAMTRATFRANAQWLVGLAHRAATAEASVRHGEERLHELNATIAGVAQASRLLVQDGGPTGPRRVRLQELIDAEMARLERMLSERAGEGPVEVSVDEAIRPLVAVQRTLGHDVRWVPTGAIAIARADDLSEVVHILLANAARHAPGQVTTITTDVVGGRGPEMAEMVEIRIADTGPGIDPWLRAELFRWGGRRPGSPGKGIGLQLGRRLMLEQGGDLRFEEPPNGRGAVFVIVVPAAAGPGSADRVTAPDRVAAQVHVRVQDESASA